MRSGRAGDVSEKAMTPPDEGFRRCTDLGTFDIESGPYFLRRAGRDIVVGMRVEPKHMNGGAMLHGGMLCTFIDMAFVYAGLEVQAPMRGGTASLSVDFINPARAGDWLEAHVEIAKQGRSLMFVSCVVRCADRCIARGSAIFPMGR